MRYLMILLILSAFACNPCKYVSKHQECFPADTFKHVMIKTVRDTITYIEENESTLEAWFECDSNNQVLIKKLNETNNGIKTVTIFKDNVLRIRSYTDSIAVLNKIIEEKSSEKITVMNPVNKQLQDDNKKLEKKLTRWKKIGRFGLIIVSFIFIGLVVVVIRKFRL